MRKLQYSITGRCFRKEKLFVEVHRTVNNIVEEHKKYN